MPMILFLDTTQREEVRLALVALDKVLEHGFQPQARLSEELPAQLQRLLRKGKIGLTNLTGVVVVSGPGSFVGTRTGVAYANALSFALKIPVLGLENSRVPADLKNLATLKLKKTIVSPKYSSPPNITLPKKRDSV